MNRRFNFTGRTRLAQDAVSIRVLDDPAGGAARFTADVAGLAALGLPTTAKIIVEPHVRQSSMRFDFGTVGAIQAPADTAMTEIDRGEIAQFRIKVVDSEERPGRLLALASHVQPKDEDDDSDRKPILPIKSADLGQQVWRLQVGPDEAPMLVINSRIPDLGPRLDDDMLLRGAIFPIAVRETLRVLLGSDLDTTQDWVCDWREFVEDLVGEALPEDPPEDDAALDLIDRAVEAFCERERWATKSQPSGGVSEVDYE